MLKWFLVLPLLTQRNLISSEPEVNENTENTRATRQLNFGECCPCPGQDAFQEQVSVRSPPDIISTAGDDSCPCRSTDSEGASSIFRPAFRTPDPFVSPVSKKEEPKPLLNPEVGLASSVLETLREVTDQEYQEALVRDAERSALQLMDPELPESEPRNVVNIILSPKEENKDDIISEATEIQNSILPPTNNNFENLQLEPPKNLLKHILTSTKLASNDILNKKPLDMDGRSASNTQGRMAPLKNNILENMKTRLNLLNLRPFLNIDNRDFLTSPNIFEKYKLKNNIKDHIQSRNGPSLDVQSMSPNNLKESSGKNAASNNEMYMEPDVVPNFKQDSIVSLDNSATKLKVSDNDNILQTSDCTVREPNVSLEENSQDLDIIPSSSKVIDVKILDIKENPSIIIEENEADEVLSIYDTDTNNFTPSNFETVTEQNSFPKSVEEASEIITENDKILDVQTDSETTTENLKSMNDMESEPSINRNIIISNLQDSTNTELFSSSKDESIVSSNNPDPDDKSSSLTSAVKDTVDSKIHYLPNINVDLYKSLKSFKKANEKFQEKLRSNVQDALQLVFTDQPHDSQSQPITEPQSEIRASSVDKPQIYDYTETNMSDEKIMSTQDLQNMSDSLLELSSLKDNAEASMTFDSKKDSIEGLEIKPAKVEKELDFNDMVTLPTSLNNKNNLIKLENDKSNLNAKDLDTKNNEIEGSVCGNNVIPRSSDSSVTKNETSEMTAQSSNSVFHSISQKDSNPSKLGLLPRNFIVQPEGNARPIEGIKDFFNSFRVLGADRTINDDNDSVFFDNQPLFAFNKDKNINPSKSRSRADTPKLSSTSNINSYKAKVASPQSLDINSILPIFPHSDNEEETDVLGSTSQKMPQTTNLKNVVKNNFENGLSPLFKTIKTPKVLQDTFSSISSKVSESFEPHTNNAFKTFRDSLDVTRGEPFKINKYNLLGKSLINPDDLFGTVFKTHEDFNDKLQAFHSDLNRRLSSISSRTSPKGSRLLWTPNRLKNSKNRAELHNISSKSTTIKPFKMKSTTMKNAALSKNIPSIESNKKKSTGLIPRSNTADILSSHIKEKLGIIPHQQDLGSKKGSFTINPTKSFLTTKQVPKSKIKFKPLKENKVTISFATTSMRPDTLKSRFKSSDQIDFLRSRSADDLEKLSKFLEDQKNPTGNSKLKSNEPKGLASEISMSRAGLSESVGTSKTSQEIPSFEELERSHGGSLRSYDDTRSAGLSEANKRKNMLLSKLKNSSATGITTVSTNRNDKALSFNQKKDVLDATQSASNIIDTSIAATSLVQEKSKDNNQTFKCKLVCIQDILDSTDTYKI